MKKFRESKTFYGPLTNALDFFKKTYRANLIFIIDQNVFRIFDDMIPKEENIYVTPAGEDCKNISEVEKCLNFFLEKGVNRKSHLVVIGGGATSDFGGFVASILLRGISWSVVPTTLLSMVDSSIGGKTGINSPDGKNLIGSFHLPSNIWIDIKFLDTLSKKEFESGMGEVIKYAFLDEKIYQTIFTRPSIEEIIKICTQYKKKIVKDDFLELGNRRILNLGHTIGHALEKHYGISHGDAVRWGIYILFELFNKDELKNKFKRLNLELINNFSPPPWINKLDTQDIINLIKKDKKKIDGDNIELITIDEIGEPKITPMTFSDIYHGLEQIEYDG